MTKAIALLLVLICLVMAGCGKKSGAQPVKTPESTEAGSDTPSAQPGTPDADPDTDPNAPPSQTESPGNDTDTAPVQPTDDPFENMGAEDWD